MAASTQKQVMQGGHVQAAACTQLLAAHFFTSQSPNSGPSPHTATCWPHCSGHGRSRGAVRMDGHIRGGKRTSMATRATPPRTKTEPCLGEVAGAEVHQDARCRAGQAHGRHRHQLPPRRRRRQAVAAPPARGLVTAERPVLILWCPSGTLPVDQARNWLRGASVWRGWRTRGQDGCWEGPPA